MTSTTNSEELKTMNTAHKHTSTCYVSKWSKQGESGCPLIGKKKSLELKPKTPQP